MSQDYVQVPADSTGKKVDTQVTANSQHRQVVVVGDPSTDANVVAIGSDGLLPTKGQQSLDFDTGAGTKNIDLVGIGLPASGGPVGVSSSNPLPVTAASLPLPSGAATSAKQDDEITALQSIDSKITGVDTDNVTVVSSTLPTGAATESTLGGRLSESDFDTKVGALTETAPTNDTNSSGLNGRLQRIAQRLTSLISAIGTPFQAGGSIGNTAFIANAGTNLNTSALALESGGNLAAVAGVAGTTSGAKVITDANGTIQQYLRGLVSLAITAGSFLVTATIATGTALIGKVAAGLATDVIYNGTTALTPKFAKIAASGSGNNTLVAAVTSKKIRVLAYNFISNGTVNAKFQDGAGGTDLTGLKYCVANMGLVAPFNPAGWFETSANTLLNLNLSAAIAVGGELVYVEV